jgi:hypothetical protein
MALVLMYVMFDIYSTCQKVETFKILVQLHISIHMKLFELLRLFSVTDIFTSRATLQGNIYSVIIQFLEPRFSSRLHNT